MTTTPSAVLLDVGGVFLLPSRAHIRSALQNVGHAVVDDSAIDRAHYVSVRVFPMDLEGDESMGPLWTDYLDTYARSLEVNEELVPEAIEHLRNEYVTGALWSQVIDGSVDGLAELVDTGVPVGIVSNSDGTIERKLREMGILQVGPGDGVEVRCVIDSGGVGVEKPDPRIFDFALEVLGLSPESIWYVGDTPAFDVVGARRAGLQPILMDPFGVNSDFDVSCVRALADIARMVESPSPVNPA
ncbi:MAG TPA: HAD family hydrolase [Acidimicrobiia bacterium]